MNSMMKVMLMAAISGTLLACGGGSGSDDSDGPSDDSPSAPLVEDVSHLIPDRPTPTPHDVIPEGERTFYVSVDGSDSDPGTENRPFATLNRAVSNAQPGDVVVMRGGVYYHDDTIRITNISGTAEAPITVFAHPGEEPILDFSDQAKSSGNIGVRLNADYWRIIGLTLRHAGHNGIRMDGSYNRLERLVAHNNHDTGIHMAGTASHNLVMNCDSYHNFNTTGRVGNNADGFGAKFDDLGPGIHFYGNRAWENSDDGFDFWRAQPPIVLHNNWSFGNGDADVFGNPEGFEGGGNGFKLGGDHIPGNHIVIGNMAFDNFGSSGNAKGFDHNNNTGVFTLIHNTAFNNPRNYAFPNPPADSDGPPHVFYNNLSVDGEREMLLDVHVRMISEGNSWQLGSATADMLVSTDTSLAKSPRQPDGSLPEIDLLRLEPGSFLVEGGVNIGLSDGKAPDVGAYGYNP